jgi:hypothetical protein
MAWAATDNFDSYSDGDLNSQNGGTGWSAAWTGNTLYDVQGTVTKSGSKAIVLVDNGSEPEIGRKLTAVTDGSVHVSMRRNTTSVDSQGFWLTEGSTPTEANRVCGVQFNASGNIIAVGSGSTTLQSYSADTWYDVDIQFDCATDKFRVSINGGEYSLWLDFRTTETQIDGVCFTMSNSGAASTNYWDDIRASDERTSLAFDTFTETSGAGLTVTHSHICTGSDRFLVVGVGNQSDAGTDVTGVTYNGVAMTQAIKRTNAQNDSVYLYYLINPAEGANNIVVTRSDTTGTCFVRGYSLTGAKQSGQPDATTSNLSTSSPLTTTLTTVAENTWSVAMVYNQEGATISASTNATARGTTNLFATQVSPQLYLLEVFLCHTPDHQDRQSGTG